MYFSEWGRAPGIYRTSMAGRNKQPIVTRDMRWPNGLSIDFADDKLYWADAKLYVQSYNWPSWESSHQTDQAPGPDYCQCLHEDVICFRSEASLVTIASILNAASLIFIQ